VIGKTTDLGAVGRALSDDPNALRTVNAEEKLDAGTLFEKVLAAIPPPNGADAPGEENV
jgi:hypothetical protein